jgi:hypothetical protein
MNLDYIAIPLLATYRFTPKLSLEAGAEVAVRMKQKKTFFINTLLQYNKVDISGVAGINWNIYNKWHIGTRYTHGITPLMNIQLTDENGTDVRTLRQHNMMGEVYLRYDMYSFSKK